MTTDCINLRFDLWCSSGDSNPGRYRLRQRSLRQIVKFCCAKLRVSGVLGSRKNERSSHPGWGNCFFGAPAGTRTPDTLLKRQVLYLLSYWGIMPSVFLFSAAMLPHGCGWLGWRDSNPLYRSQSPVCYHYTTSQDLIGKKAGAAGLFPFVGWDMGLEPTTPGTTIRCSSN